ncbi:RagB/SusD family nutrient uptake outer membrane protein [uncultured Tenacibaculum sp.]|uniref:RagB/SusD family nutrient uptake outer membrane protein n=1 Tax=uncultured Tenacibaculum sp. TaxID=174713 RepID=UPI002602CCCC|nr:RagB/SusD family nutrient uptake outer membrane protein [uncultured Tenacibaculum sp.]
MKFNKIIINSLIVLGLGLSSCDDLERFPTDSIATGESFETINDARAWNNGLYASLRANVYGNRMFTQDVQADQLNASLTYGNRNGAPHRWLPFLADAAIIEDFWEDAYNSIANINLALANFDNIETADSSEANEIEIFKGEAHLARAYYYHRLVVRYGKMYDPASAATDLGVPLVLQFDLNEEPSRSTVEEVYTQILNDIAEAKTLLAGVNGASGAIKFNIDVAKALEARVLLYKQDYANAKTVAEELINSGSYPLINTEAQLRNMWTNDFHQEVISSVFVSAPNELGRANNIYLGLIAATGNYAPDFIPSQWVIDAYEDADFRKNIYFDQKNVEQEDIVYPDVWLVNKYPGNPTLFTGATSNFQHAPILFRIAEMYLISAESDLNGGLGDPLVRLNQLRQARNASMLTGLSGTGLQDAVRMERFRELAFEGFRLDDLRRWNLGITRRDPQNTTLLQTGTQFDQLTQPAGADKFTWGIPTRDITVNPNLRDQQNPGW